MVCVSVVCVVMSYVFDFSLNVDTVCVVLCVVVAHPGNMDTGGNNIWENSTV